MKTENLLLSKANKVTAIFVAAAMSLLGIPGPTHAYTPSCTLLPARSDTVGGEVFLGGDFIELGLSASGSWGTSGAKPAGFRGTSGTGVGLAADLDGYCATPSDNTDLPIDFFLPGSPEERWGVGFTLAGTEHYGSHSKLAGDYSSTGISATHTVSDETSGDNLSAKVVSVISLSGTGEVLRVTATHSFQKSQAYFRTSVVFENLSGAALTDVRYHRSFDPDNARFQGGQFETRQTILDTISDGGTSVVQAKLFDSDLTALAASGKILSELLNTSGITSEIPILFYSAESESVAYFGGFTNSNPYKPLADYDDNTDFFDSPQAKDATVEEDGGMGIIVRTLSMSSGATSSSLNFVTSLDSRDFSEISAEIAQVASGGSSGNSSNNSSQPDPLLPRIDSIFPTRVVAGESVSIIGKRWTCTNLATFDSSSSPVAHGWLTPQLEQINFQVPSDQTLGPLQVTLDSCLGSFEINGLVTVVPGPMSITHLMYESEDLYEAMTDVKAVSALHRGDYMKVHCIVNSQKSEAEKINIGYELCSTALGQMPPGSRMVVTLKENYLLENTWTRVWFGN